jgi:hypothetical protein
MPEIDLGVDYTDVQDEDKFEAAPPGTYQFTVKGVEPKTASTGRPMLKWTLGFNHEGKEYKLFNNTVLPWNNPATGELDVGGVGMLVAQCKAVGLPWTGNKFKTEDYIGRGGTVEVVQKIRQVREASGSYVDDPNGDVVNDVGKFVY